MARTLALIGMGAFALCLALLMPAPAQNRAALDAPVEWWQYPLQAFVAPEGFCLYVVGRDELGIVRYMRADVYAGWSACVVQYTAEYLGLIVPACESNETVKFQVAPIASCWVQPGWPECAWCAPTDVPGYWAPSVVVDGQQLAVQVVALPCAWHQTAWPCAIVGMPDPGAHALDCYGLQFHTCIGSDS